MILFRRRRHVLVDEPKSYHLPTSGDLTVQPNVERACEVYWAAAHPDWPIRWDATSHETRTYIRTGIAAVLHWTQQQEKQ